jgi:quinol monooxygenase YgiN
MARFALHEGRLDDFKRLSAECMAVVRDRDTGTLQYDIFISEDETECLVLERYEDSQALINHVENIGGLMAKIMETGSVTGAVLGEPSDDLRRQLDGSGVRLFRPLMSL